MPRRRTTPADALLEVVAKMPWWAGIALALCSYLLLHHWAGRPVAATAQAGQIGAMVTQTMGRSLASVGQYVVPLICLAGAGISAWRRKERQQLIADVARNPALEALDGMGWRQFEKLVGEGFRLQGYQVLETGGVADGGVDLVLTKGTEKYLLQCKQWRAFKVGVDVVRELYGVMAARGTAGGFVVTSGRFTDDAVSFAAGRNVLLIDGPRLHTMIRSVHASATNRSAVEVAAVEPRQASARATQTDAAGAPECPVCAEAMVKRIAKRGANAGREFWGCSGYPACRGMKAIG